MAPSSDNMIWVRGYPTETEVLHWLDMIEQFGRPERVGLLVMAHANKVALAPDRVGQAIRRCIGLGVPYRVGLTTMAETGPLFGTLRDAWQLEAWADVETWRWIAQLIRQLAAIMPSDDPTIVFDLEVFIPQASPWAQGGRRTLAAIDQVRIAEKQLQPRNDVLLKQLAYIRDQVERRFVNDRRDWPDWEREALQAAMQPLLEYLAQRGIRPGLMPAGLDYAVNRIIHDELGGEAYDESAFDLAWALADLSEPLARARTVEASVALDRRAQIFARNGQPLVRGFHEHVLRDYCAEVRNGFTFPCWVFPRKEFHYGMFSPAWRDARREDNP